MLNLIYCTGEGKVKGERGADKGACMVCHFWVMGDMRLEARIVDTHRERGAGTIMVRCLQGGQTQTQNLPRWWASRYATENAVCSYPSAACLLGGFSE
jgi:hypothetical protein